MNCPAQVDVLVLGAGPAGCCAALRLLQLGYRVALAERAPLPRAHVGESLTPGIGNILDLLQLRGVVDALPRATASLGGLVWEHPDGDAGAGATANAMVDRAGFDHALFGAVARRGGTCLAPATLERLGGAAGAWQAVLATPDGAQAVEAGLIIDARGRRRTGTGVRIASGPPLLAVWTDLEAGPPASLVEAHSQGWLWGAARPDGRFRVMGFCDPGAVRGQALAGWLPAQMGLSRLFRAAAAAVIGTAAVQACAATPEFDPQAWRPGYLKTGDAAFSIDPLSSSGVEKAMRFALQTVAAAHTVLSDPGACDLAREFYEERLAESVARHAVWAQGYYQLAWPGDAEPFWRARRAPFAVRGEAAGVAEKVRKSLAALRVPRHQPARAAPAGVPQGLVSVCTALRIVDHPCVVEDRVQLRRAIVHPNLSRPVAFLEGVEIVPLLELLSAVPRLPTAIELWSYRIPNATATRIAGWLCAHGLVQTSFGTALHQKHTV